MFPSPSSEKARILVSICFLALAFPAAAMDWPASTGVEIGLAGQPNGLPDDYEPSGAVWHPIRQKLILVDDSGLISELDPHGGGCTNWNVGEDLEGITIINPSDDLVYLAVEHPDGVLEFDLNTGSLTGRYWDLTPWLQGPNNHGLEALTYGNGHFYAGLQEDGSIFVFNFLADGQVTHLQTIAPHEGRDDLSGLHFDSCTGTLFAIHDGDDLIEELRPDGTFIRQYDLPGDNQEGVALIGGSSELETTIFIAQDSGEVWLYEQYPVAPCIVESAAPEPISRDLYGLSCYPNPFNPSADISFDLIHEDLVDLNIHDLRGQHVRTLVAGLCETGANQTRWDGRSDSGLPMPSGVYFALMETADQQGRIKLLLLR